MAGREGITVFRDDLVADEWPSGTPDFRTLDAAACTEGTTWDRLHVTAEQNGGFTGEEAEVLFGSAVRARLI